MLELLLRITLELLLELYYPYTFFIIIIYYLLLHVFYLLHLNNSKNWDRKNR